MENFTFHVATDIRFGENRLDELPEVLDTYGKKVLLVYGGGSIKHNGLYDKVTKCLTESQHQVFELSGVEPNPRIDTVRRGIEICRQEAIDVLLAVGGGSTIDCAKAVAAGTYYEGDAWDMVLERRTTGGKALPIVTILTLAATGSEMNSGAVISNPKTKQKLGMGMPATLPKVSFLDPENTYTVPPYQTAAGSADILSHLMENYFNQTTGTDVQDFMAEGLMRAVITHCPTALETPADYDARSNLMWASSLALNGLTGNGKSGSWSCHPMEHELSAYYDITHGIGLAILTPRWMKFALNEDTVEKFAQYARNVWQIVEEDDETAANQGIEALYRFFKACGIPMTLPEVGITSDKFDVMAKQAVAHSQVTTTAYVPMTVEDIQGIFEASSEEMVFDA